MSEKERLYFCIDMKTFYASVECAEAGLDPFRTDLVVADVTRGKNALCLAITPAMKARGIRNRCRLSEIPGRVRYRIAAPRMQLYIDYSADIYAIYLRYFSPDDIHVYSIDEAFIDVTDYLSLYHTDARSLAKILMQEIAREKHIPSTVGIGTNLYLAKIALDITAKHAPDHMGILDEETYRATLWDHRPITDFWQIAAGTAQKLADRSLYTMRRVAEAPQEMLYLLFGVNAELLIDHAWGRESCRISDIKAYRSKTRSVSHSQILPRDYTPEEARTVLGEMILSGSHDLLRRRLVTNRLSLLIGYGYSESACPPTVCAARMREMTALFSVMLPYALELYDTHIVQNKKIRRLGVTFCDVCEEWCEGYDLFTDPAKIEGEHRRENAEIAIAERFGKNAILRAENLFAESTARERNTLIGGHRAGEEKEKRP